MDRKKRRRINRAIAAGKSSHMPQIARDMLERINVRVYGSEAMGFVPPIQQMRELESLVAELNQLPQHEQRVRNFFIPGAYGRELTMAANSMMVGAIHRYGQINTLSQGEVLMMTPQGIRHLKAPCTVVTPPGTMRLGYTLTEIVWLTTVAVDVPPGLDDQGLRDLITFRSVDDYIAALPPLPPAALLESPPA